MGLAGRQLRRRGLVRDLQLSDQFDACDGAGSGRGYLHDTCSSNIWRRVLAWHFWIGDPARHPPPASFPAAPKPPLVSLAVSGEAGPVSNHPSHTDGAAIKWKVGSAFKLLSQ